MDDFIRPVKPQPPVKKKNHFKEVVIILVIIFCLGVGFVLGYLSKQGTKIINKNNTEETVVQEVYDILDEHWYNLGDEEINLQSNAITGLVEGLGDIHSSYWTNDQSQEFNQSVNGDYEGIGVSFSQVSEGALVIKVFDDSPAKEVGMQVGDIILEADGTSLKGLSTDEIKALVRGKPGTKVKLSILRNNEKISLEPTRNALSTAVEYQVREQDGKKFGYIEITTFGNTTATEVENALEEFQKQNITTLVLDLRDNGGGYLTAAIDILELFFEEGDVLYQMQQKDGPVEKTKAKSDDKFSFANGYILVNGNTASASEMVAGAMQEELGYQLVGEQTYGKGSAQTQATLSDGSVLKYTYAKWMIPSGFCVNGVGLTPDIEVKNHDISEVTTETMEEDLRVDQVSSKVMGMQKMLYILGYECGRTDGYFSTQTEEALKQFEQANNLSVDGIYNNDDQLSLIGQTMIHINQDENDLQYKRLLEVMK
ncbi:MAG: S41 family peptidase [Coprobacillaceae bacterium]